MLAYSQLTAEINPLAIDAITIIATYVVIRFIEFIFFITLQEPLELAASALLGFLAVDPKFATRKKTAWQNSTLGHYRTFYTQVNPNIRVASTSSLVIFQNVTDVVLLDRKQVIEEKFLNCEALGCGAKKRCRT
jgi:hypothetical protein